MVKARITALAGAAALALVGPGYAAIVAVDHPQAFIRPADEASRFDAAKGAGVHDEFLVDQARAEPTRFSSVPPAAVQIGAVAIDALSADYLPLYAYLESAGRYVLDLDTLSEQTAAPGKTTPTSVPLPGANWLFGSALAAFLWISGRRRF